MSRQRSIRLDLKIQMRSHLDVAIWTLVITDIAVIGTAGYYRLFVAPSLYEPILHHAVTIATCLGLALGYFGCWQIMLGQNYHYALRRMNETDTLTGVHTRARFFMDASKLDVSRGSVVMIDVDRFKSINDTYGHQYGDNVLVEVARRLEMACRTADGLARYGGEEFVVSLPETDLSVARACAERLRLAVAATDVAAGHDTIPVTISLGVAKGRADDSIDTLIARADKALLMAKSTGSNRVITEVELAGPVGAAPGTSARSAAQG